MIITEETIKDLKLESPIDMPYFFEPFKMGKNIFYSNGHIALKFVGDEYTFDFDDPLPEVKETDLFGDKKIMPAYWLAYVEHLFLTPSTSNGSGNVIKKNEALKLIYDNANFNSPDVNPVSIDNLLLSSYYIKMLLETFGSFQYKIILSSQIFQFCERDKAFRDVADRENYPEDSLFLAIKFIELILNGEKINCYGLVAPMRMLENEEKQVIQLK